MLSVKQGDIKYHFLSFGMTQPGIEPGSPGSLWYDDLGLNFSLLDHWWTLYSLGQWPGNISKTS